MTGIFSNIAKSLLLVLILATPVSAATPVLEKGEKPVRIGVLALRGKVTTLKNWAPTAAYLGNMVPGYRFEVVPLLLGETERAVKQNSIDFLVTSTGQYVDLEYKYAISRIATLRKLSQGKAYTSFGAVIFARADRPGIKTLADLKNQRFMAVDKNAFGGFQMAWYEMHRQGIDPARHFSLLKFSGLPQDQIPLAVLSGKVDAGTVRTDVLERMAREGKFRLDQFRILNARQVSGFPFRLSTDLYPEWPIAKLANVDNELAKKVQLALLIMDEISPAARAAGSAGWTVPLDYSTTHKMMKAIGVGPYLLSSTGIIERFLKDYWIVLLVLAVISVPPFWYYVIQLYLRSREAAAKQKQAELEWLQGMDMLTDPTMLLDLDDHIIRANQAFYKRIQKPAVEAVGHKVTDFFHPQGEAVPCKVCQARHELRDAVITVEANEPQNHHGRPMEITIRVVRDTDGKPVRVIQSIRDLTEVRQRELMLEKQNLILEQIVRGTAGAAGENFFRELVRVVAETLEVDYVFIAKLVEPGTFTRVRILSMWNKNDFMEPFERDISGTPCEGVADRNVRFYGDDVQQLFPNEQMLADLGVRSYLGVPFFDSAGTPQGLIAIMHGQPITEKERFSAIMQIFADRVGVEIERQNSMSALEESEERFKGMFDTAPDPIIIINEAGNIVQANSRFEEHFGYDQGEIIGKSVELLVPEEFRAHHPQMRLAFMSRPVAREMGNRPELMAVRKDSSRLSVEIALSPLDTSEGRFITATIRDVTERKLADRELERLASFPMMSPIPVMEVDMGGRVTYENPVSSRLFPDLHKLGFEHPLLQDVGEVLEDLKQGMRSVVRDVTFDGAIYEQQLSYVAETEQLRIYSWDVTNLHEMTKQMHHQATHDALTGLMNRREFEQQLERIIQSAVYEDKSHVLCYIDLDQFKLVNDVCGHSAGDELLRQLSRILRQQIRDSDNLARLGGDEFGLLLTGCPMERAKELAERLREAIARFEFIWEKQSFRVGASIGLVEINRSSGSLAEVMSAADSACYAAKDLGRNRIFVYHPDDAVVTRNVIEMNWTHRIRQALDNDEFILFFQTIEPLNGSGDQHCEILLRMIDRDGQLVLPGAFIPAAERFGLMSDVDLWVISHSLEVIKSQPGLFKSYSINLSGQTLGNPSAMQWIIDTVESANVDPEDICFEITETAMISNLALAERYIRILRGMGCKFALDDFGTGLSSFSYLKELPVDRLKIDSHFVRDVAKDEVSATMVMSINIVGQAMDLRTVAEGVEDTETLEVLKELGIDYAQGYAISRPEILGGQCVTIGRVLKKANQN